jgi:hypothetical protein
VIKKTDYDSKLANLNKKKIRKPVKQIGYQNENSNEANISTNQMKKK